jgi:hypothetical protein
LRDSVWRRKLCCFFSEFFGFHGVMTSVAGDYVPAKV